MENTTTNRGSSEKNSDLFQAAVNNLPGPVPAIPPSAHRPSSRKQGLPFGAVALSVFWLCLSIAYIILAVVVSGATLSWTPATVGGLIGGVSAPLVVVWLIVLYQQRMSDVDEITAPVRRQLHALLAPGAAADARVKRVTQALSEQAETLRHTASVALDDSSAAMNALTKQSNELKRLSGESIAELSRIALTADGTLKTLQGSLGQIYVQTGSERERALSMVTDLEKHIRECLTQVDRLATNYEGRLAALSKVSDQMEQRTRGLVGLTDDIDHKVQNAASDSLRDLDKLEALVAELGQRSAAIAHHLGRPVDALSTAADNLDRNMRQSQEMLVSATNNLEKIGDNAISRASSLVTTLADRLSSMELVGAKLVSIGAAAQADTSRYVTQIEDIATRIRDHNDEGHKMLRDVLREFESEAERALERSGTVAEQLKDSTDTLSTALKTSEERFDALAWDIETRTGRLNDLSKDTGAQLESARLVLDSAQDSFTAQVERLNQTTQRLQEETRRADAGVAALSQAGTSAHNQAEQLLSASEKTKQTLGSIENLVTEQQIGVQQMAATFNAQITALTAAMVAQQNVLKQATTDATEGGEQVRASLREQVQAISDATVTTAGKLDQLHTRLMTESEALRTSANDLEDRLTNLVTGVKGHADAFLEAERSIGNEQLKLDDIAAAAETRLADLNSRLTDSQTTATTAMDGVAERLAVLRNEIQKADTALTSTGDTVSERSTAVRLDSDKVGEGFAEMLSRLENLSAGMVTAGDTLQKQGDTAGELLSRAKEQLSASTEHLRHESDTARIALEQVSASMETRQGHMKELQSTIEIMSGSLADKSKKLRDELEATLLQGTGEVSAAIKQAEDLFTGVLERLTGETNRMSTETVGASDTLERTMKSLQDTTDLFTRRMETAEKRIGEVQTQMRDLAQNISGEAEKLNKGMIAFDEQVGATEARAGKVVGTISNAAEELVRQDEVLAGAITRLQSEMGNIGQAGKNSTETLSQLAETLRGNTQTLSATGADVNQQHKQLVTAIAETQAQLNSVATQMADLRHAAADMTTRTADLAKAGQGTETRLTETIAAFEDQRQNLVESAERVMDRLGNLGDQFTDMMKTQARAEDRLEDHRARAEAFVSNIVQMGDTAEDTLTRMGSRVEALTRQAAVDGNRINGLIEELIGHEDEIKQRGEGATQTLRTLQGHIYKAGQAGFNLFDQAESRLGDAVTQMAGRMADLSRYGDGLVGRLQSAIAEFTGKASVLGESGVSLTENLSGASHKLAAEAANIAAVSQALDSQMQAHVAGAETSRKAIIGTFEGVGKQLQEIDTRTNSYLVTLQSRTGEVMDRLNEGVKQLAAMPESISSTHSLLTDQIEAARVELARLRHDLIEVSGSVELGVTSATAGSGTLLANMQEISRHSHDTSDLLTNAAHALQSTGDESANRIARLGEELQRSEDRSRTITEAASTRIANMLDRLETVTSHVEGAIENISSRYQQVAEQGTTEIQTLLTQLDGGTTQLQKAANVMREDFGAAVSTLAEHEGTISRVGSTLGHQLSEARDQVESLLQSFTGMDTRIGSISPTMTQQQAKLETFLSTLDRTLAQIVNLQNETRGIVGENVALTEKLTQQEHQLTNTAQILENKLNQLDTALSGPVLGRLQQSVEHAQVMEGQLGRLTTQAGRLDGSLQQIRVSLDGDVRSMQQAEAGISLIAEKMTMKLLEAGSALGATLSQLQRGGQASQSSLLQANEETQRLVVRLEQVRALVKNMMGGIATDISEWQYDLKRRLSSMGTEVTDQLTRLPAPRPRTAAPVTPLSAVATAEALHALSVDLYRLMQSEIPALSQELMPIASRQPMSADVSKTYTRVLADQPAETFVKHVKELAIKREDFRQYLERFATRFDQLIDVLGKQEGGSADVKKLQQSDLGRLYERLAAAVKAAQPEKVG